MTKRDGFTLIELMIVIAVLGVACGCLFTPLLGLVCDTRQNREEITRQESLTTAFLLIEKAFARSSGLTVKSTDEVGLLGGECTSIRREAGGRILVIAVRGTDMRVDPGDGIVFGPFQEVDARTVWCPAQMSEALFPMFWRCKR